MEASNWVEAQNLKIKMEKEEERRKEWKRHINNIAKIKNKKVAKEYSENPQVLEIWKRKKEIEDMRHKLHNEGLRLYQELSEIELAIYLKQNPQVKPSKKMEKEDLYNYLMK